MAREPMIRTRELLSLLLVELESTHNVFDDMRRRIGTHAIFQVIDVGTRETRGLRKLSLGHAVLLPELRDQLCEVGNLRLYCHLFLTLFCCRFFVSYIAHYAPKIVSWQRVLMVKITI